MAYLTACATPFCNPGELEKSTITFSLYIYYQGQYTYDGATDSCGIPAGLAYPPDKVEIIGGETYVETSASKANAFVRDVWGVDIPAFSSDYGELEKSPVTSKGGKYYIRQGDYQSLLYWLRAYEYLGDDLFYVSFDADDRNLPGGDENRIGYLPDYCRLLVARSNSAWGFTVRAELKGEDDSLLPADFPLPLYAA